MLFRILNIREHKNFVFCDSFDGNFNKIQLMIDSEMFNNSDIKVGTVIEADYNIDKNKREQEVYKILSIKNVMNHDKNMSYKSIQNDMSIGYRSKSFASALNGGQNLRYWQMRQQLISEIRSFLISKQYVETNTFLLMNERGTSTVNPMSVISKYEGIKYLKITHELELKKLCYITLKSLFEIGYVTRDVYNTTKNANQYLTLELVSPSCDSLTALEFYERVYKLAIDLAKEYSIKYSEVFNKIEIIDILDSYKKIHSNFDKKEFLDFYKEFLKRGKNIICINAPIETPLAINSEYGIPLETKWAVGERGMGHGYYDQSNAEKIKMAFNEQLIKLRERGINAELDRDYIEKLELAGIDTKSLNFGIDRFMYKFLDFDKEDQAIKILGI